MNPRFRDYTTCLSEFEQVVLIQCPQCDTIFNGQRHRCARSIYIQDKFIWQIACIHCGYSKTADGKIKQYGTAIDSIFRLPLWLQIPCCSEVLWAYNTAHLEFLEWYVQATLRERQGDRGYHRSIAVRLPRWINDHNFHFSSYHGALL